MKNLNRLFEEVLKEAKESIFHIGDVVKTPKGTGILIDIYNEYDNYNNLNHKPYVVEFDNEKNFLFEEEELELIISNTKPNIVF